MFGVCWCCRQGFIRFVFLTHRDNKLGLDITSQSDESIEKVEQSLSLTPARSWPLPQLSIKGVAIGTSHSAIVTGE